MCAHGNQTEEVKSGKLESGKEEGMEHDQSDTAVLHLYFYSGVKIQTGLIQSDTDCEPDFLHWVPLS